MVRCVSLSSSHTIFSGLRPTLRCCWKKVLEERWEVAVFALKINHPPPPSTLPCVGDMPAHEARQVSRHRAPKGSWQNSQDVDLARVIRQFPPVTQNPRCRNVSYQTTNCDCSSTFSQTAWSSGKFLRSGCGQQP